MACRIDCLVAHGFVFISVYLETGRTLMQQTRLLEELAQFLSALSSEWVLAGDFQNTPTMLAESVWAQLVGGTIMCSGLATCTTRPGREIDFFVVSRALASQAQHTQLDKYNVLRPHTAVTLQLSWKVPVDYVPVLRKVLCYPETPVIGPHRPACVNWQEHTLELGWREWLVQANQWLSQHHASNVDSRQCEGVATVKYVPLQQHLQRRHRKEHIEDEELAWRWLATVTYKLLQQKGL
eukprot:1022176-Amphidinium_carterae.1